MTLDCSYNFKQLIKPKELKHTGEIIRMLVGNLQGRPTVDHALKAAYRLQHSWLVLVRMQNLELRGRSKQSLRRNNLQSVSKVVLDDFATLLTALRMQR